MTAGVHNAGILGGVGEVGLLVNGESVYVSTEADGSAGMAAPDNGGGSGVRHGNVFDAESVQAGTDEGGSLTLLAAQFGAAVESLEDFLKNGGEGEGLLFQKGEIVKKVPQDRLVDELFALIEEL